MILKNFELNKKKLENFKFFLLYGNNRGHVQETINSILRPILPKNVYKYEETEIIKDPQILKEKLFNKSFFESEKLIIINRVGDKLFNVIDEIISENIEDVFFILTSGILEKKSKLRKLFENNKQTICIPFYEENLKTLGEIVLKFIKEKKISISQEMINIIVDRAKGDRINLQNELNKIESYMLGKKSIDKTDILKITNLSENYNISELVDSCLSKNKNKITKILNENNFSSDDCVLIIRTYLSKLKRLLNIYERLEIDNSSIEKVISSYKPPIFWKDKDIIKQQLKCLNLIKTKNLIYKTNEVERMVKKYPDASIKITTDFVTNQNL